MPVKPMKVALLLGAAACAGAAKFNTLVTGENFVKAAAVHVESGEILFVGDPGHSSKDSLSLGIVLRGGGVAKPIDSGRLLSGPVDLAISGDTAYVVDQGGSGIVAFKRSAPSVWVFLKRWNLGDILPACDEKRRSYRMPESVAIGSHGEVYIAMAMVQHTLDNCAAINWTGSAVRRLDPEAGTLNELFDSSEFFLLRGEHSPGKPTFHMRALATTTDGDVLVAGYGDDGMYFGHSVWLWPKAGGQMKLFAGQQYGQVFSPCGDGGPATSACLNLPWGVSADCDGKVYIADSAEQRIRVVAKDGTISTLPNLTLPDGYVVRKLHHGFSDCSLLLGVEGLDSNSGMVIAIDLDARASESAIMV